MWIIASLPFWIIGFGLFVIGAVGISETVRGAATMEDKKIDQACWNILGLMIGAGIFFLIAAKICS